MQGNYLVFFILNSLFQKCPVLRVTVTAGHYAAMLENIFEPQLQQLSFKEICSSNKTGLHHTQLRFELYLRPIFPAHFVTEGWFRMVSKLPDLTCANFFYGLFEEKDFNDHPHTLEELKTELLRKCPLYPSKCVEKYPKTWERDYISEFLQMAAILLNLVKKLGLYNDQNIKVPTFIRCCFLHPQKQVITSTPPCIYYISVYW